MKNFSQRIGKWLLLPSLFMLAFVANAQTPPGQAIELDGTNGDNVNLGNNSNLDVTSTLTISIWLQSNTDPQTNAGLVSKWGINGNSYRLYLNGSGNVEFQVNDGGTNKSVSISGYAVTDGVWHHIIARADGSNLKLDVDDQSNSSSYSSINANSSQNVYIGQYSGRNHFSGKIDEFRFWSTSRTQTQVEGYKHQPAPTGNSNLEVYYKFEGNVNDQSTATTTINGTNNGGSFVTSNAVITDLAVLQDGGGYSNGLEAIWMADTTVNAEGLQISNSSSFSSGEFVIFGHNGNTGRTTNDLSGISAVERLSREWVFDEELGGQNDKVDFLFNVNDAQAGSFTTSDVTNVGDYILLERTDTTNNFSTSSVNSNNYTNPADNEVKITSVNSSNSTYYTLGTENTSSAPLPVELTAFRATKEENNAKLNWKTASETNNSHFIVQSMNKNDNWENLGKVNGHGTSVKSHAYTFIDRTYDGKRTYYRLKQVDFDGSYQYSNIVTVSDKRQKASFAFQLTKNPIEKGQNIRYTLEAPDSKAVTLTLMSLEGRTKMRETIFVSQGINEGLLRTGKLTKGVFLLIIKNGQDLITKKVFVR